MTNNNCSALDERVASARREDGTGGDNQPISNQPISIGALVADPQLNAISFNGMSRHVEPKVMDLLVYLVRLDGEVASRGQLLDEVWHRQYGGDESLTRSVSQLRKAFRDIGACSDHIQTVPKRGYRFIADTGPLGPDDCALCSAPAEQLTPRTVRKKNVMIWTALANLFSAVIGGLIATAFR
jgi:DNA-binding winged helix-turn-helix (wHTH) protein